MAKARLPGFAACMRMMRKRGPQIQEDGFHYLLVLATMPESRGILSPALSTRVQQIRDRHAIEEAAPSEEDLHFFRTYAGRYGLAGHK